MDPLPITPFRSPLDASLTLPGSKSITNRALVLAALADGETRLEGALFSRDTRIMLAALTELGFHCESDEANARITVRGRGGAIPAAHAELHVGNAGTAARFLTGLLALHPGGRYRLDGDAPMRERPISGLLNALHTLGAAEFEFHGEPGHFPFTMRTKGIEGGRAAVDAAASSQILSALLLAGSAGSGPVTLACPDVRPAYVEITLKMRESFGAPAVAPDAEGQYRLEPARYRSPADGVYRIEPDVSAASYFLALTLLHGGRLRLPNLGPEPLQGDAHFVEVLAHHGLEVSVDSDAWIAECPAANDPVRDHREIDFGPISDTFLTYAAVAPLLGGSVHIAGIGHTRRQETDRIAGMAAELAKLGQLVSETGDSLTIQPKPNELRARALAARNAGERLAVDTYEDHRFAMSFAVLGTRDLIGDGLPWLAIRDPACCGKTFPAFFEVLDGLREASVSG